MPPTCAATKVKDPEYSNWLKVSLALYYLKDGLHSFIQGEVDSMHQSMLQKLYGGSVVPKPKCSRCKSKDVKQNRNTYVWNFRSPCLSSLCDVWLTELMTLHTNPTSNKLYWDNCDVTAWPFVPWECAKLYMPRGQLAANTGPVKCDSQALLTLMANCTYFHGKLSPAGLTLTHTVSKIRNSVMHSGEMRLSDNDRKSFIQDIIHLIEDPTHLKSLEECKQAVDEINRIANDSIDVFFNVELEMIALTTAVNAVRQDMGKQEKRTLVSVESLKEEYIQLAEQLRTKIDTVENRVDIVEDRQDTVENDLETVENRVDHVEDRVVTVENRQDTVENRVDSVEDRQDTVENRIGTVEDRQNTIENKEDTVVKRVDVAEKRLDTIERDVESVREQTNTALQSQEKKHKEMHRDLQSVMERTRQQQVELSQAISTSLAPLGVRVEAVEEKLTSLQESGHRTAENIACIEDIIKLRDDLIKAYRNLRCVQVSALFEKMRRPIDNIYVDLVIEEKQDSRNIEGSKYGSTQRKDDQSDHKESIKVTSYKQIFLDERCLKVKRIYLRGKSGSGKTTFCRKVLHAWCNAHEGRPVSKDSYFQDEAVLKIFDLLFYLNLREVSVKANLLEAICDQFPLEEVPTKDVLGNVLKNNGDKVLFILDGLDEMVVKPRCIENVVTRRVYPNCCFLISSRPWKMSQMELHEETEIDLLLDLQGFSKQNAIKFAENIFSNCYKDGSAISQFIIDLHGNKLATQLLHVPLILLFMAQVWYENERSLPNKLHELYILLFNLLTRRMMEKYKQDPNHKQTRFASGFMQSSLPTKLSETSLVVNLGEEFLLSLCEVAYHFLLKGEKESSLVFEETNLLKAFGNRGKEKLDVALDLGILSVTESVSYLHRKTSVSFLHKTMQEFLTAIYFTLNTDNIANFISSMADLNAVQQSENIIVFLVGLMPELGNRVLEKVNELCNDDWEALKNKEELKNRERLNIITSNELYLDTLCGEGPETYRLYNISNIYFRCNNDMMEENVLLNVSGLCLKQNNFDPHPWNPAFLQSLNLTGTQNDFNPHPWSPAFLQNLNLVGTQYTYCTDYVLVDLRGLTGLVYLRLHYLTCELYLPESGSLSVLIMITLSLSSCCCDALGKTLTHCSRLEKLAIHNTDLHNCLLDLSSMTKLTVLYMSKVILSSSCCDLLGRTLTHCARLERLNISDTDLRSYLLDILNLTELTELNISGVVLSSSCCDIFGRTMTHWTKLRTLYIYNTDFQDSVLDFSNMKELTVLDMSKVSLSSRSCNRLGSTLTHCAKLEKLSMCQINLHNCLLDLSNVRELKVLKISDSSCDVFFSPLTYYTKLKTLSMYNTGLQNSLLDLSNMTELTDLDMSRVIMSSSCCDVLGRTLMQCVKLNRLSIQHTDLYDCMLDLTNMTELTCLNMSSVTMSSSCCDELGNTLSHCTKLESLDISDTDLHNCLLDLSNIRELGLLYMSEIKMTGSCCDVLGSTLLHCVKLQRLTVRQTDLRNCVLDLSNMTELTSLDMSEVTLSSSCCDVIGNALTHCTKLKKLRVCYINLHNGLLDLSNMTDLTDLHLSGLILSSNSCDVLGSTLTHCTKLQKIIICNTDLHNCLLDVSNMTKLTTLIMSGVTLSSSCCDVLGSTLAHCSHILALRLENTDLHNCMLDLISMTQLCDLRLNEVTLSSSACQVFEQSLDQLYSGQMRFLDYTYEKLPSDSGKWKVNLLDSVSLNCMTMTSNTYYL